MSQKEFRLSYLSQFVGPQVRKLLFISILIGAVAGIVESGFVYALQLYLFSLNLIPASTMVIPEWMPTGLAFTLALFVTLGVFRSITIGAKIYVSRVASQIFAKEQRLKIVNLALNLGADLSTSETVSIFSDEINRATQAVVAFSTILTGVISTLVLFSIAFWTAPIHLLIGIGVLAVLFPIHRMISRWSKVTGADISEEWQRTNSTLLDSIRNHFLLNVYGLLETEKNRARGSLEKYFTHYKSFISATSMRLSSPLVFGIIVICVLSYLSLKIILLPGAILLSFLFLFLRMVQSAAETAGIYNDFRIYAVSLIRLDSWIKKAQSFSHEMAVLPKTSSKSQNQQVGPLEFRNISFNYPEAPRLFEGLNLKLNRGDCLVVTGESGTGKSTFLALALGLLPPSNGVALWQEQDVRAQRDTISALTGYVGPTPFLIEGTIKENLIYGNPSIGTIPDKVLAEALKRAEIFEFVESLPKKIETSLNEIGSNISTGQRQRIAMARALLRRPKILILDEATSNLDYETEKRLIHNLTAIKEEMILIAVSHRPLFANLATQTLNLTPNMRPKRSEEMLR